MRYEKRGSNAKTPIFFNHRKTQNNIDKPLVFPFFLYFLQSDLGVVLQKYDLYIRSYIAQTTFFHQYQRELTYWRESNPGLPPGK